MFYAIDKENRKIQPEPHMRALCPICNEEVVAKCGDIVSWHWAHMRDAECDNWCEHDDDWAFTWKNLFPPESCEVNYKGRRADIITKYNEIIKLQRNMLSPAEIFEREKFFGNLIWIFDVRDAYSNIEFRIDNNKKLGYASFRWKYPKKTLAYTVKPTLLDFGVGKLFVLKKMYKSTPCGGYGYFISIDDFMKIKFNTNYTFKKLIDNSDTWSNRD